MEIFQTVQNFVTEKKIGEVMWWNEEKQTLTLGIVMRKENAGETMRKIKEHLKSVGVMDVGFVVPLRSKFDEEYVRRNYRLGFLE